MLVIFELTQGPGHQPDKSAWEWKYTCATITKVSDFIKKLSITLTSATEQMWTTWQKNIGRGAAVLCRKYCFPGSPEKTADISRRHHWFPRQMTSEKQAQKFHTDDVTLLSSIKCFWLVEENFPHCMTHDQSEALPKSRQSRVISMEFPRSFLSDVNSRGNQCWRRGMSAVSSDYCYPNKLSPKRYKERTNKCEDWGRISAFWGLKSTTWKENFLLIYCHKSITETLNAS